MALVVKGLTVYYDTTPILWDLDFVVPKGVMGCIIGPNGAGKTTLLQTILGLKSSLTGSIEIFGSSLDKVRGRIAYVPQKNQVDWTFPTTCLDVVLMGRYGKIGLFRLPTKADRSAAHHFLSLVGLKGFEKRQIGQLSEGQKQRIFFARALMQDADFFFLDEPFAGIDLATEQVLVDILKKQQEMGKTILVVHHDLHSAQKYFDWSLALNMRLIACGPLSEVFAPGVMDKLYGKGKILFKEAAQKAIEKSSGVV